MMGWTRRLCSLTAALVALAATGAAPAHSTEIPAEAYRRVNAGLVENYLVPRYQRFTEAAASLEEAAARFCAPTGDASLEAVRGAFGEAMGAWMGVQHVTFGPAELFMRGYRIHFWPQARGRIESAVREILATGSEDALSAEAFRDASVAVQGLPAAEELLYGLDTAADDGQGDGVTQCDLLEAVTRNLREMADGIVHNWTGGDKAFVEVMLNPGPENVYYRKAKDATLDLFKSFHGGLRMILDAKLTPVMGESAGEARPALAESASSGRSLANIVVNLKSLRDMYLGSGGPGLGEIVRAHGDRTLDDLLRKAFRMTIETARSISGPLTDVVADPAARPGVEKLATQVQALKQIVKTRLAEALEVGVGFNALDGD